MEQLETVVAEPYESVEPCDENEKAELLEHELERAVGLAHIAIDASREDLLTRELAERGWRVAGA